MFIPAHYVAVLVFLLLSEFGVIFIYTIIGLVKSNPLPWMMPPSAPSPQACRCNSHEQQILRGEPQFNGDAALSLAHATSVQVSTSIVTATSMIYQTFSPPAPPTYVQTTDVHTTETSVQTTDVQTTNVQTTNVQTTNPTLTVVSQTTVTSFGSSSDANGDSGGHGNGSRASEDSSKADDAGPSSTSEPPRGENASMSGPEPTFTSLVILTSTLPSGPEKPRPTSTTTIVL